MNVHMIIQETKTKTSTDMIYTVKGTLFAKTKATSGTSSKGNSWQKQTIVVEFENNGFKNKIAMDAMNEKVDDLKSIRIGEQVEVRYTIDAREWNDRWFNDVKVYSFGMASDKPSKAETKTETGQVEADLPF